MPSFFRRPARLVILSAAWLVQASPLWAQATTEDTRGGLEGRYALGYGLVMLAVILGLVNVCRPGKRKGDPKKPT